MALVRNEAGLISALPDDLARRLVGAGNRGLTIVEPTPIAPEIVEEPEAKPKKKAAKKTKKSEV